MQQKDCGRFLASISGHTQWRFFPKLVGNASDDWLLNFLTFRINHSFTIYALAVCFYSRTFGGNVYSFGQSWNIYVFSLFTLSLRGSTFAPVLSCFKVFFTIWMLWFFLLYILHYIVKLHYCTLLFFYSHLQHTMTCFVFHFNFTKNTF